MFSCVSRFKAISLCIQLHSNYTQHNKYKYFTHFYFLNFYLSNGIYEIYCSQNRYFYNLSKHFNSIMNMMNINMSLLVKTDVQRR